MVVGGTLVRRGHWLSWLGSQAELSAETVGVSPKLGFSALVAPRAFPEDV